MIKSTRTLFSFITVFSLTYSANAQYKKAVPDEITVPISRLVNAFYGLCNSGKFEDAWALFKNPSGVSGGRIVRNWEEHKQKNVLPFLHQLDSVSFKLAGFTVDSVTSDVAIVIGQYDFSALQQGKPVSNPRTAFAWVFKKEKGEWGIVHWQTCSLRN